MNNIQLKEPPAMSFARWSADSDVYVYKASDGINIHVATYTNLDTVEATAEAAADRLEWLRKRRKVQVPQYGLDNLRAEK